MDPPDPTVWLSKHVEKIDNDQLKKLKNISMKYGHIEFGHEFLKQAKQSVDAMNQIIPLIGKKDSLMSYYHHINKVPLNTEREQIHEKCEYVFSNNEIEKEKREEIVTFLQNMKSNLADRVTQTGSFLSLTIGLYAVVNLYSKYNEAKVAPNVREESKQILSDVGNLVEDLIFHLPKLVEICDMYENETAEPAKIALAGRIVCHCYEILDIYMIAKKKLSNVEAEINSRYYMVDFSGEGVKEPILNAKVRAGCEWLYSCYKGTNAPTQCWKNNGIDTSAQGPVYPDPDISQKTNVVGPALTKETLVRFREDFNMIEEFIMSFKQIKKLMTESRQWYGFVDAV